MTKEFALPDNFDSAFDGKNSIALDGNELKSAAQKAYGFVGMGKCYETHPVLELGGGKFIGGSCGFPVTNEADVYIGFERNMKVLEWTDPKQKVPMYISYPIVDMSPPKDAKTFKELVQYAKNMLAAGLTVHAGCIGGHGRTGTFLAALVKEVTGNEDAITWVRENYCKKAVESEGQVNFLHEHFGIKKVAGAKTWGGNHQPNMNKGKNKGKVDDSYYAGYSGKSTTTNYPTTGNQKSLGFGDSSKEYRPVNSARSLLQSGIL